MPSDFMSVLNQFIETTSFLIVYHMKIIIAMFGKMHCTACIPRSVIGYIREHCINVAKTLPMIDFYIIFAQKPSYIHLTHGANRCISNLCICAKQ